MIRKKPEPQKPEPKAVMVEPVEQTDEQLMAAIQERRPESLGALYDRYAGILKALILRVIHNESEADDLLQEIFMEIWNHAQNFSQQKGKPLGWIVTLARRRSIDRLRKYQAYQRVEERFQHAPEQQPDAWTHNVTEDAIDQDDRRALLVATIRELPPAQQQVIELAFFKGMSQREIASHTNIPLGTIKTRLELGLKKITEALKAIQDEF